MRILLTVSYEGTRYAGWQYQPGKATIEGCLREAFKELSGKEVTVTGASRTDAGVHALGNLAVVDTDTLIPPERLKRALMVRLPEDIRIREVKRVPEDFHPRKTGWHKTYVYRIDRGTVENPLLRRISHQVYGTLLVERMREAAALLVGTHDFTSFSNVHTQVEDKVRTIDKIDIREEQLLGSDVLSFWITGNGFLYNMVRIIVGTLLDVGRGRIAPEQIREILEKKDRQAAGATAPAKGLMLVGYEQQDEGNKKA